MSGHKPSPPLRNRKRSERGELPQSFLPQKNPRARIAYLSAWLGLIPGIGLVAGPIALLFGFIGYRAAKSHCEGNGLAHAVISMTLGALETIASAGGLLLVSHHYSWL